MPGNHSDYTRKTPDVWGDKTLVELLKDLWVNTDYSVSKIAEMIGTTKAAIAGKAHRLGLKRASPIKRKDA